MNRDFRIDILRTLAILLIIFAHTSQINLFFQLRTFDVPLMAILLGMSFYLSQSKKTNISYTSYVIKRFERLVIPAWIFLTIFFIVMFFISFFLSPLKSLFSLRTIVTSYTLLSGIGYVWIIRVFFTIAIFSPLLWFISKKFKNTISKITVITILLLIQQLLCLINYNLKGISSMLFQEIISVSFGYMILALLGMWIVQQSNKENFYLCIYFTLFSILCGYLLNFPSLQSQKYPPSIFFISYGITASLILLLILSLSLIKPYLNNKFSSWTSKHSLEIYYWHIFPVTILTNISTEFNWVIKFTITFAFAFFATYLQVKLFPNLFTLKFLYIKKIKKSS